MNASSVYISISYSKSYYKNPHLEACGRKHQSKTVCLHYERTSFYRGLISRNFRIAFSCNPFR